MSRLALLALFASGCFYTDPINQRPSADIVPTTSGELYRGAMLELDASTYDPEGQQVSLSWRAYLCTDATTPSGCDPAPFPGGGTSTDDKLAFMIPITRADGSTPVEALRVILEATDDHGATAKPPQELLLAVSDHPPDVTLRQASRYGYVVGTPVELYASVGDVDDGAAAVMPLDWQVFSPASQPAFTLDPLATDQPDPTHIQSGKLFTAQGTGDFDIQVTATDPVGKQDAPHFMPTITIVPDHAPCLTGFTPAAPPSPDYLPISAATPFQVLVVSDDLDPYPTVTGDPIYGAEQFTWSLLPPGASARQPLSIVGNSVAIDPSNYTPGDVLELRVEVQDRNHTAITCPDNMDTCSVISDNTCIQRLTWRIEVQ